MRILLRNLKESLLKRVDESPLPKAICSQDEDLEELVKASDDTEAEVQYEKEILPDWWGNKFGFVSGGLLGAQYKKKKSRNPTSLKIVTRGLHFRRMIKKLFTNLYKIKQLRESRDWVSRTVQGK